MNYKTLSMAFLLALNGNYQVRNSHNINIVDKQQEIPSFLDNGKESFSIINDNISINNDTNSKKFLISDHFVESDEGMILNYTFNLSNDSKGGIVFGIRDEKSPTTNGYYAFMYDNNKFTLDSYVVGSVHIGNYEHNFVSSSNINIKVELTYSCELKFYANNELIFDVFDYEYHGGYYGILSEKGTLSINNLNCSYNKATNLLDDLKINNESFVYLKSLYGYDLVLNSYRDLEMIATPKENVEVTIDDNKTNNKTINFNENKKVEIICKKDDIETRYVINLRLGYNDSYRPLFHKSTEVGFVNDPNGLVYEKNTDTYHMFSQFNRALNSDASGNKNVIGKDGSTGLFTRSWSHAISKDLVHWMDMPIAIYPYDGGEIFSGSLVIDENNTSGLFKESDESRMVAIYTWYGPNWNHPINASYSTDFGVTFKTHGTIFNGSNNEYGDYRDPKAFYSEEFDTWIMLFGGWTEITILTSNNLLNWSFNSKIKGYDFEKFMGECPDLLIVKNNNEYLYALTLAGEYYILGDLVKNNNKLEFISLTPMQLLYNNPIIANTSWNKGCQYAGVSFNNEKYGRVVMVNWMVDYLSDYVDDKYWNGYYTLPCEVKLEKINGMYSLSKYPVEEINLLHENTLYEVTNKELSSNDSNILEGIEEKALDIDLEFTLKGNSKVILRIEKDNSNYYQVTYDSKNALVSIDFTSNGINCPWDDFNRKGHMQSSILPVDGKVSIRTILDILGIETFANKGVQTFYSYLWNNEAKKVSLKVEGDNIIIDKLVVSKMGGIH